MTEADENSVQRFIDAVEGTAVPGSLRGDGLHCDYCDAPIDPPATTSTYAVNKLVADPNEEEERGLLGFARLYCADCNRTDVFFPCRGYAEFIIAADITAEMLFANVRFLDFSAKDDGLAWSPADVYEAVFGISVEELIKKSKQVAGREVALAPEDIADQLAKHDVDISDLVDAAGEVRRGSDALDRARQKVRDDAKQRRDDASSVF